MEGQNQHDKILGGKRGVKTGKQAEGGGCKEEGKGWKDEENEMEDERGKKLLQEVVKHHRDQWNRNEYFRGCAGGVKG